ncbi:MAG: bifunctional phosphopantothenoylcysteine decarboxylase/phosphopantothenate--cysteine ligase CoaBC [Acidimicrobiia bacterium]
MLNGRRIVLGVTGGIAAYKAIELCRRLVDAGAHVSPVLTNGAKRFVGETTFSALASEPVQSSLWNEASPIPHTKLGQNADLIVVAPATAKVIADLRAGRSHDLLTATLLATRAPVLVCPAMHTEMWEHPAVQDNLNTLAKWGFHILPPEEGRLAGGDEGKGRLAAPEVIFAEIQRILDPDSQGSNASSALAELSADLAGLNVLVTAGGTREAIDPVRYIGNRSSGKQGFALVEEAVARGAKVTLVSTTTPPAQLSAQVVMVETADQMHAAVTERAGDSDIVIMAAAVADFRPEIVAPAKIKKHGGPPQIVLVPTVDILAELGSRKPERQTLVGFAAETTNVVDNATDKMTRKNVDLIVANDVSAPGVGFEHDTNSVVILSQDGRRKDVALTDKRAVAKAVIDAVVEQRQSNRT